MHRPFFASLIATTLFLGLSACERHTWEETQKLHQPHHGSHDDHAKPDDSHDHDHGKETHEPEKAPNPHAKEDAAKPVEPTVKGEPRNLGVE